MAKRKYESFICDFETYVSENPIEQEETWVWGAAYIPLWADTRPENVELYDNLSMFLWHFLASGKNCRLWFHNAAFDGAFIIDWLLSHGFKFGKRVEIENGEKRIVRASAGDLFNKEFTANISANGIFYSCTIMYHNKFIEILDSMKIFPMSVAFVSEQMKTKYKKTALDFVGNRTCLAQWTEEDCARITNDVLIMQEAMRTFFKDGNRTKTTIGSNAKEAFSYLFDRQDYRSMFPNLKDEPCPAPDVATLHDYVYLAYRGGWNYVDKRRKNKVIRGGVTLDCNSLYPYIWHSSSGFVHPRGKGHYIEGEPPAPLFNRDDRTFFVRFSCRFHLRPGYLPMVQIKGDPRYMGSEMLENSDVKIGDKYYRYYQTKNGVQEARVTLCMIKSEFELFLTHYAVEDLKYIDCVWFWADSGVGDEYINHYFGDKILAGDDMARRTVSKLFLTSLIGKFGQNDINSYRIPDLSDGGVVKYTTVTSHEKDVWYIPLAASIVTNARVFMIKKAQENYNTFCYCATDSLHLSTTADRAVGVDLDQVELGKFKIEREWSVARFIKSNIYAEITSKKSCHVACSGGGGKVREMLEFALSVGAGADLSDDDLPPGYTDDQKKWVLTGLDINDFAPGLTIHGKLYKKTIKGGVILFEDDFTVR